MTHVERFFAVLEGKTPDRHAFFPDITTWYVLTRITLGDEQPFWPGQYVPEDSPFHERPSRLEGSMGRLTFVDFYRHFSWGLPCHVYDWYDENRDIPHGTGHYRNGVRPPGRLHARPDVQLRAR